MAKKTHFFLGANSAQGFYSLYDQLQAQENLYDFIILKGGPGVGKSTFMKYVAEKAEKKGYDVEYIHCSGDPASLDAVILPQLGVVAADGTAPHVIEPQYPAAVDRYVNLGQFYDVDRMKERRREVIACTEEYRKEYGKAYACLRAAYAVRHEGEKEAKSIGDPEKMKKRLTNTWLRERKGKRQEKGREQYRFLGGLTPDGRMTFEKTLDALCGRVYEIQDPWHIGASVLEELRSMILKDGWDVITCLNAENPQLIEHILIPELSLAFVTTGRNFSLSHKPWKRMRLECMIEREKYKEIRGKLRLKEQIAKALEEEGLGHLKCAGEKHGELELIYHPFVDFDGVLALAQKECDRIFGEKQRNGLA